MAIAPTTGKTASNAVAGNTLAFAAYAATAGRDITVVVAMVNTANSVLSITDTALNTFTLKEAVNGTGVRLEIWEAHNIAANVSDVLLITLQVAQTDLMAAAFEEYSGASAVGNTATTATGSDRNPNAGVVMQDGNNFSVIGLAFACLSGDTFTAILGTSRQSVVPALTSVGVALYDNTQVGDGTVVCATRLSTARQWAAAGLELRSGGAAIVETDYPEGDAPALNGDKDTKYLYVKWPLGGGEGSGGGGAWPFVA